MAHVLAAAGMVDYNGRQTVNVLPTPSRVSTPTVPPCCSTICRTAANPMPVPAMRPTTLLAR
jgi:hypothetical protein